MALGDSSLADSESFSTSDSDPYSSESASPETLSVDVTNFPQPIPIIGAFLGYNSQSLSKLVHSRVERASKILQRAITEDEATALAYWTAKQVSIISYCHPIGVGFGAVRAYQTSNTFQFPFYKPDPGTFPSLTWPSARIALISGPRAVAVWHATRLVAYGIVSNYIAQILFTSYALSVAAVGELRDPRLKNYTEAIAKLPQNARGKMPREAGDMQGKDASKIWKDGIHKANTNANPEEEDYGGHTKTSENLAFIEDGAVNDPSPREHKRGNFQTEKQSQSSAEEFDEASPTGGRGIEEDKAAIEGSTWERIRREASTQSAGTRNPTWPASPAGQATRQPPRPNPRAWRRDGQRHPEDSFAYSKSEEERQLARGEAQKDFDARVEQERKGGDFGANSSSKKPW